LPVVDALVLIPGYQEGPRIGAVVSASLLQLPVIVVDDGSTDGTADFLEREAPQLRVVRMESNGGRHRRPG